MKTIIYKYENYQLEFTPLENGKCEYLVDVHDFGNLESIFDRILNYQELGYWIKNITKYIKYNRYGKSEI